MVSMLPMLIGIAGGTGSGKTTVARKLAAALPDGEAALIQHDWYYRDRSHLDRSARALINFDEPAALDNDLLLADLRALKPPFVATVARGDEMAGIAVGNRQCDHRRRYRQ